MDNIQVLDCTLREVALPQYAWGTETMTEIMDLLCRAGVQIVECGFLKNGEHRQGSSLFSDTGRIDEIANAVKKHGCQIAALMDYGRFDVSTLPSARDTSLDIIRVCFKKHERHVVFDDIKRLQDKGYCVFVQHVDVPSYTEEELLAFLQRINEVQPEVYCMVDTFGTMYEEDLQPIWMLVNATLKEEIAVGIHGHNNLMMANALAISMIRHHGCRNLVVDGTLLGAGRGAGNANTEILLHYLQKYHARPCDLTAIYRAVDKIRPILDANFQWGYTLPYFMTGITGTHVFNVDYLLAHHPMTSEQMMQVIGQLDAQQRKKYDYGNLDSLAAACVAKDKK